MIKILSSTHADHQLLHQSAMHIGLKNIGIESEKVFKIYADIKDIYCTWGWRKGKSLHDRGNKVLVMERGYVGDRFKYTSLGWNGLNNYASFPDYLDDRGDRFRSHGGIIKPWRKTGRYILILGQVKGDASLKGQDLTSWYFNIANKAKYIYGLPVYFRPHPEGARRGGYGSINGVQNIGGSLDDAIGGALFTIAYNSNSCLDSILAGVPCYAGDKGTMAWDLCMKDIGELYYPEREEKVHKIAWNQFSIDEIMDGWPLRKLFL